jgi:hypothetical protein
MTVENHTSIKKYVSSLKNTVKGNLTERWVREYLENDGYLVEKYSDVITILKKEINQLEAEETREYLEKYKTFRYSITSEMSYNYLIYKNNNIEDFQREIVDRKAYIRNKFSKEQRLKILNLDLKLHYYCINKQILLYNPDFVAFKDEEGYIIEVKSESNNKIAPFGGNEMTMLNIVKECGFIPVVYSVPIELEIYYNIGNPIERQVKTIELDKNKLTKPFEFKLIDYYPYLENHNINEENKKMLSKVILDIIIKEEPIEYNILLKRAMNIITIKFADFNKVMNYTQNKEEMIKKEIDNLIKLGRIHKSDEVIFIYKNDKLIEFRWTDNPNFRTFETTPKQEIGHLIYKIVEYYNAVSINELNNVINNQKYLNIKSKERQNKLDKSIEYLKDVDLIKIIDDTISIK